MSISDILPHMRNSLTFLEVQIEASSCSTGISAESIKIATQVLTLMRESVNRISQLEILDTQSDLYIELLRFYGCLSYAKDIFRSENSNNQAIEVEKTYISMH